MTQKDYRLDSYKTRFDAVVLQCIPLTDTSNGVDEYEIILDRTCFYPEGGGQPADIGLLGGKEVTDVRERGGIVSHILNEPLQEGLMVSGEVDWNRRLSNMQQHSGEHILSGIIHQEYALNNVGFHIGSDFITVDVNGVLTDEQLLRVETRTNEAIWANLLVEAAYPGEEKLQSLEYRSKKEIDGPVRIVTVPGYDCCACCGTHVKQTGEIGMLKIISSQKYKGGTRIFFLCGVRALAYIREIQKSSDAISVLLSSKPSGIAAAVDLLQAENVRLKAQVKAASGRMLEYKAAAAERTDGLRVYFESDLSPEELRQFAVLFEEKVYICVVLSGNDTDGYKYAAASLTADVRPIAKSMNAALNGRGGGTERLTQGSVLCERLQIEAFFDHFQP